jgi:7-cyano-7-deazaguanine synthase
MSGGIDSTIATLKVIEEATFDEIQPVFIDYGQKARKQEWSSVLDISKKLELLVDKEKVCFRNPKRIDLYTANNPLERVFNWSRSQLIIGNYGRNPYLENRNLVLLSLISSYVESQLKRHENGKIIVGFRNEFADTKGEFVRLYNGILDFLLKEEMKTITVEAPIIDYDEQTGKRRLVRDFSRYHEIIALTWSCYEPNGNGNKCGKCDACMERKQALHDV